MNFRNMGSSDVLKSFPATALIDRRNVTTAWRISKFFQHAFHRANGGPSRLPAHFSRGDGVGAADPFERPADSDWLRNTAMPLPTLPRSAIPLADRPDLRGHLVREDVLRFPGT